MADTHIVLMNTRADHSDQTFATLRVDINGACSDNGGQLLSLHWTLGAYDAVAVVELDSALMFAFAREIGAHLADIVVMRAFDDAAAAAALDRWSGPTPDTGHRG